VDKFTAKLAISHQLSAKNEVLIADSLQDRKSG
jgi:hypothetical protein